MPTLLRALRRSVGNQAPSWPFRLNRASPQARGLIGWWPGVVAGGAMLEMSGRAERAAFAGTPQRGVSPFGNELTDFDARADYADAGNFGGAAGFDEITIWFWAITTEEDNRYILSKDLSGGNTGDFSIRVEDAAGGDKAQAFDQGNNITLTGTTVINDGLPHLWTFRLSPATGYALAVDGIVEATNATTGNTVWNNGSAPLQFGGVLNGNTTFSSIVKLWGIGISEAAFTDAEIRSLYDPATRWDLYEEYGRRTYVFPATGGATTRTVTVSLESALRKQRELAASLDGAAQRRDLTAASSVDAALARLVTVTAELEAAVRAVRTAQADLQAAVQAGAERQATLDAAVAAAQTLSSTIDAAVRKAVAVTAVLDANLVLEGVNAVTASLDAALRKLVTLAAGLDAAIQHAGTAHTGLDAALALSGQLVAALDAVAKRLGLLVDVALDAALRDTASLSAALDAAIGTVVLPGQSRTFAVPGRAGRFVIPPGDRRH